MHHALQTFGAFIWISAALASVSHLDPGFFVMFGGGIIWAIATWRRNRHDVAVQNNADLTDRVELLEAAKERLIKEKAELDAELKRRPALGSLETLLRELIVKLTEHDGGTAALGKSILESQEKINETLGRNTEAIRLWATERAKDV